MSYSKIYYGGTYDIDNNELDFEIWSSSLVKIPSEVLLSGEEGITIEYDCDEIFQPLKMSTCTLKLVTKEPLLDLFTGKLNEIVLKVFRNKELIWMGFLSPNVYTSPYKNIYDEFSIEFVDVLSQTKNKKFKDVAFYKSFYTYIKQIITEIDEMGLITNVLVQDDVNLDITMTGVLERNFIDETGDDEDGASSYNEALESIMNYLGATMFYMGDSLVVITPVSLNSVSTFTKYMFADDGAATSTISGGNSVTTLGKVHLKEGTANISLGSIYNKITLVSNNNPIDDIVPDLFDSIYPIYSEAQDVSWRESRKPLGSDEDYTPYINYLAGFDSSSWGFTPMRMIPDTGAVYIADAICPEDWTYTYTPSWSSGGTTATITHKAGDHYFKPTYFIPQNYEELLGKPYWMSDDKQMGAYGYNGIMITKYATHEASKIVSSLDWKTAVNYVYGAIGDASQGIDASGYNDLYITCKKANNQFIGKGGAIVIALKYVLGNISPYRDCSNGSHTTPISEWVYKGSTTTSGYYTVGGDTVESETTKYDSSTQELFKCSLHIGDYFWNGTKWTTELEDGRDDCFFLATEVGPDDTVFNTERTITNQVSYTMNLSKNGAEEGAVIRLPDKTIYGPVQFKLWGCKSIENSALTSYTTKEFGEKTQRCYEVWMTDLVVSYRSVKDTYLDIFNLQDDSESDVTYTNVIDEKNVTSYDDLTLTTNTYNTVEPSYSYVITQDSSGVLDYKTDETRENQIVEKYVNYYSEPKLNYSNNLKAYDSKNGINVTPKSLFKVKTFTDKTFVTTGCEYDLINNSVKVSTSEQ